MLSRYNQKDQKEIENSLEIIMFGERTTFENDPKHTDQITQEDLMGLKWQEHQRDLRNHGENKIVS